ncbi:hypothetical protein KAT80_01275 [Candidatus Pacearchaeota archaeon]|nr:hypothetical protein [Candidatus Pacearchaeota archaeon]
MGRTRIAKAVVRELKNRINSSKKIKKDLIKYLQKSKEKYDREEISYTKYAEIVSKKYRGKTIIEWVKYHNRQIKDCEDELHKQKKRIIKNYFFIGFFSVVSILLLTAMFFYVPFLPTGFIIGEKEFTQTLNLDLNESTTYEWQVENPGILNSVKISGLIKGKGKVRIYLDELLILDSNKLKSKGITGKAIEELETEKVSILKTLFRFVGKTFSKITGKVAEEESTSNEVASADTSDTEESYSETSEEASQEDSSPSLDQDENLELPGTQPGKEEPSASEKEEVEKIKEEETEEVEEEKEEPEKVEEDEEKPTDKTPENITEELEEEFEEIEKPEEVIEEEAEKPGKKIIKEFSNICEETCDLKDLNLNKSSYTLRIEISNAELKLDKIKYKITPIEIPEEKIPEEIPENITEEIEEEIPEVNITEPPVLIKEIPNIKIPKNSVGEIKISEYFSDAEQYYLLQTKNILTTTYDHTIKIQPDKDFTGTRKSKIIATNEFGETKSNFFNIIVSEINLTETNITNLTTEQYQAVIGQPVKWRTSIELEEQGIVKIKLPKQAKNIIVNKIIDEVESPSASEVSDETSEEEIIEESYSETSKEASQEDSSPSLDQDENLELPGTQPGKEEPSASETKEPIENITEEKIEEIAEENVTIIINKSAQSSPQSTTNISESADKINKSKQKIKFSITGTVIKEEEKGIIKSVLNFFKNIFSRLTGRVIDIEEKEEEIEIIIDDNATKYEIEYETPAPYAIGEDTARGKRIKIIGPENIIYENVLTFTELDESLNIKDASKIKIKWLEQNKYIPVQKIEDKNNNGIYDYIEWISPSSDNQTFEIIIEITKAEHLDENREFISDIYEDVYQLDDVWSETIPDTHYIRVVFEQPLDSSKDITIYPRIINGTPKIEVYEIGGTEKIAEFTSLNSNEYNKVYLTNLQGTQDTFDLRILDGEIEFDHIIDPVLEGEEPSHLIGTFCDSSYNSVSKIMTDTSCLNYDMNSADFLVEGREFGFAVGVSGNYYRLTDSVVKRLEKGKYDEFLSDYYIDGVNLTQLLNFSDKKNIPVKIYHSIENTNPTAIEDVTFYYVFEISNVDSIEINGSLCDWKGNCEIQDYINRPVVNFNSEYDFRYDDLLNNGFILSDIRWAQKKLWVGFSKGDILPGETIELDPTFSTSDVESVAIAPLDENKIVVGACDEAANAVLAYIYYTNGTSIANITVDSNIGTCDLDDNLVAITPLNNTLWVIAYFDDNVDDIFFAVYDDAGTQIGSTITVDDAVGTDGRVDVDAINDTTFWLAYFDDASNDIFYAKYHYDGTALISPDSISGQMDNEGDADTVGIAALNETDCVVAWHDDVNDEISFIIPNIPTKVVVESIVDSQQVSVAAFNSTDWVIGYYQQGNDDIVYATYSYPDTSISGIRNNGLDVGASSGYVSEDIAIINSTHFVQKWYDASWNTIRFSVNTFNGVRFSSTSEEGVDVKGSAVASEVHSSGVGLVGDNIAVAYIKSATDARWAAYEPDGTVWDGNPYGWLNVSIQYPENNSNWNQYDSNLTIKANVTCVGRDCGTVYALARYNLTANPDTAVNTTKGGSPFYAVEVITEGVYITDWDIESDGNTDPFGITTNNTFIWTVEDTGTQVYKWYMNGTYIISWDIEADGNTDPRGITTNSTFIWTVDNIGAQVYKWYMNGTYISSWDTEADGNTVPYGITTNSTFIWTVDRFADQVYKWDMDGTAIGNWDTYADGNTGPFGITTNSTFIWTVDGGNDQVYKWHMNGTYISDWDTEADGNTYPRSITTNSTFIWTVDDGASAKVYKWHTAKESEDPNPKSTTLNEGESYQFNWTLNVTTASIESYLIDVLFNSSYSANVPENNTDDMTVNLNPSGVDNTKPTYSGNQTNQTTAGLLTIFAIKYADNSALNPNGGYIFSTNNSGAWANESLVMWSSTPEWANVTKTLPANVGNRTDYRWYANDSAGNVNNTGIFSVTTTSADNPPEIYSVTSISSVTLTDGPGATYIIVNFSVSDANGAENLVNSSATINFTKSGEDLRINSSCAVKDFAGNYANYTCNVTMWWWDASGNDWKVYANITDQESNLAINNTNTFTVNSLTGFVVSPSELTFVSLLAGATNQTPSDYFTLNNTGNKDITGDNIEVNATDLFGETTKGQALWAGNFSFNDLTGGDIECNVSGATEATAMVNMTYTGIYGAALSAGNFTKNDGTAQENLYLCLREIGLELSQQQYSTSQLGSWTIRIALVALTVGRRQKSKKKQKKKKIAEDDKLLEALNLIADELKDTYSLNKKEIIQVIIERLKKKYQINKKEILEIVRKNEKLNIPITIFSKELGALESLVKYMKENLNMTYKEVAEELNRDERTIWTAYKKASEKQKEPMEIKKTKIFLPISIFENKKLTILESIITYLKEKEMKYSEIAKLLKRDQRNIWTIYSRAITKKNNNI